MYIFRTLLICLFAQSIAGTARAQQMACCSKPVSATAAFASLGVDVEFTSSHDDPLPYRHHSLVGKEITYPTADGKEAQAYELKAESPTNNYLFVIHEWWGMNDHIKKEGEKLYNDLGNVNVLVLDLYDGKVATTQADAQSYMQSVKTERAHNIINGALDYVGSDARIGSIGWCFGGGWSLQTSLLLGEQAAACVIYYGMPEKDVERLKTLQTDVLGLFASQEQWINPQVVAEFEENMKAAGKDLEVHSFDAQHAFANPSNPKYDSEATKEAYDLTLQFLRKRLQ